MDDESGQGYQQLADIPELGFFTVANHVRLMQAGDWSLGGGGRTRFPKRDVLHVAYR